MFQYETHLALLCFILNRGEQKDGFLRRICRMVGQNLANITYEFKGGLELGDDNRYE